MIHKSSRMAVLVGLLLLVVGTFPVFAQEPVTITWFIGLGTGSQADQLEAQQAVVDAFNASQKDIVLETIVVNNTGTASTDALQTLIASGKAPDIIGPVGVAGSNAFEGQFLDLQPLIDETGYDTSDFVPAQLDFWRKGDGLYALPMGVYPSFIFYNRDLFDEAGLAYPPHKFGENYADGRPWNIETLQDVAMKLTVDGAGEDATSDKFDPSTVEQWGWYQQWTDARGQATLFGASSFVGNDGKSAVIPENWSAFYHWYYDGIWKYHFIPSAAQANSDVLNTGNVFPSGKVAMSYVHLWYLASAGKGNWDIAAAPSYNDKITAKLHADGMRISKDTKHPKEAFEALTYLIGDGMPGLLKVYGAMPPRTSLQASYFKELDPLYPQDVDWQVAIDALAYPDVPSHESNMPNFVKANDRIQAWTTLYPGTEGLDIDAELEKLRSDLDSIFKGGTAAS